MREIDNRIPNRHQQEENHWIGGGCAARIGFRGPAVPLGVRAVLGLREVERVAQGNRPLGAWSFGCVASRCGPLRGRGGLNKRVFILIGKGCFSYAIGTFLFLVWGRVSVSGFELMYNGRAGPTAAGAVLRSACQGDRSRSSHDADVACIDSGSRVDSPQDSKRTASKRRRATHALVYESCAPESGKGRGLAR